MHSLATPFGEDNMDSEKMSRIIDILEDKRGVSVVETGEFQISMGGTPNKANTDKLVEELDGILSQTALTKGCREYLRGMFLSVVGMGLPTDMIIDLSGLIPALEAEDCEKYEIGAFLGYVCAMIDPEAHDVKSLLQWGRDIQATYSKGKESGDVEGACSYLQYFINKE
jgi:hypothetical protein